MPLITKRVITDLAGTSPYLVRWSIWLPFGWSIKLHKIVRPDDDRCSHNHPFSFLRIILWGGYIEEHGPKSERAHRKPWRPWAPWRLYYCPANFKHRITKLHRSHSWTPWVTINSRDVSQQLRSPTGVLLGLAEHLQHISLCRPVTTAQLAHDFFGDAIAVLHLVSLVSSPPRPSPPRPTR